MVFTTGQMLGIGVFTAVVLAIGALLLKLDSVIGTNYDLAEDDAGQGAPAAPAPAAASAAATSKRLGSPRRKRRR